MQKVPHPGAAWVSMRQKTTPVGYPIVLLLGRLSPCLPPSHTAHPRGWLGADHRNMSACCCRQGLGCSEKRTGRQTSSMKHNLCAMRGANRQRAGICRVINFKETPATPPPDRSTGMAPTLENGTPVSLRGAPELRADRRGHDLLLHKASSSQGRGFAHWSVLRAGTREVLRTYV